MINLAPSILSADFANLGRDIQIIHDAGADYVHIDVMDGVFVPAITFGPQVVKAIRSYTNKIFDVHLMIENPEIYIQNFVDAGADMLTVHVETCVHLHRTIQKIKSYGIKVCVALNPSTPLTALDYILKDIDMVLLMSVNPGFGGQTYIENITGKIQALRKIINDRGLLTDIEVDGGIKLDNVRTVIEAGANVIVAGSAVFNNNIAENIKNFKKLFKEAEK